MIKSLFSIMLHSLCCSQIDEGYEQKKERNLMDCSSHCILASNYLFTPGYVAVHGFSASTTTEIRYQLN